MTVIDRLSSHTTIERDDTGTYMVTTIREVAAAWGGRVSICEWASKHFPDLWYSSARFDFRGYFDNDPIDEILWRIPTTSLHRVYGYREGEPWCWYWVEMSSVRVEQADTAPLSYSTDWKLHFRAVLPCDGSAEALETLHRWMKEQPAKPEGVTR